MFECPKAKIGLKKAMASTKVFLQAPCIGKGTVKPE